MKARLVKLLLAMVPAAALITGLGSGAQAIQSAQVAGPASISSVTCIGNSFCLGTGFYIKDKHSVPLSEEWNGKAWRIIPNPSGYQSDITCGGPTFCLASATQGKNPAQEVVWNGKTWSVLSQQPPGSNISCFSPTFCEILNPAGGGDGADWNGTTWQDQPTGSGDGCGGAWCTYTGVGCASASICWNAGNYCGTTDCDGGVIYFSDIWNGTEWNSGNGSIDGRQDLACAGRSFCLKLDPPAGADITRDWGNTWQPASVNLAVACHHLGNCGWPPNSSCGTPYFCLAMPNGSAGGALVWNGKKWGFVKLALVSGHRPSLSRPSCGGPRNCMAAGTYQLSPRGAAHPVVEHWNGKAWQVTRIVSPVTRIAQP
ncbi:MAG TPA: hypothetical protein VFI65_05560 [Streptosporangiaceae bacterium]|nr:hypothetical protein [Streptosporangiaceae bacterium]